MGKKSKKIERAKAAAAAAFPEGRARVFKKAEELSATCGAEVLVLLSAPDGKVHSYASPSVETIVNRFVAGSKPGSSQHNPVDKAKEDMVNKVGDHLQNMKLGGDKSYLLFKPISEQTPEEMAALEEMLLDLKGKLGKRLMDLGIDPLSVPFFKDEDSDDDDDAPSTSNHCGASSSVVVGH